jgi:hypothetical protein
MKKFSLTLLALALGSTITFGVAAGSDDDAAMLTQISNYRRWTRVNSEPVQSQVAVTPTVTGFVVKDDLPV